MHLDLSTTFLATLAASLLALLPLSAVTQQDPTKTTEPNSVVPTPRNEEWGIGREKECIRRAREAEPGRVVFVGATAGRVGATSTSRPRTGAGCTTGAGLQRGAGVVFASGTGVGW